MKLNENAEVVKRGIIFPSTQPLVRAGEAFVFINWPIDPCARNLYELAAFVAGRLNITLRNESGFVRTYTVRTRVVILSLM